MESHEWKLLILNIYERKSAQSEDQIRFQEVTIKPGLRDTLWRVTDLLAQQIVSLLLGLFLKQIFAADFIAVPQKKSEC